MEGTEKSIKRRGLSKKGRGVPEKGGGEFLKGKIIQNVIKKM